jgi:Flp pilus assembly protein TadB
MVMPPTDRSILISLAKIGERQESLAKAMEARDDHNAERYESLVARLDERHETLLQRLEAQEEAFLERLEAAKGRVTDSIRAEMSSMLEPLSRRVADLDKARTKLVAMGSGAGMLATVAAWVIDHFLKILPVIILCGLGAARWLLSG